MCQKHLFLLCGSKISAEPSVFVSICYESVARKHLLLKTICWLAPACLPSVSIVWVKNICYEAYHLSLQKQLVSLTIELSAGHVMKYYKGVLDTMYVAVCIKKLMKTSKFEIIVRRCGSLVGSVPSGSNSTLATT